MRECLSCKIKVGGENDICPICQNSLRGEPTAAYWPSEYKLRKQAFWYKLQLFILLAISAIGLILDFVLDLYTNKHWSLVLAVWVIVGEVVFNHYLHRNIILANVLTMSTLHVALLLYLTGWYLGFITVIVYMVIPIMVSVLLILNLIFALIDKKQNALVYLLLNILVGLVSSFVLAILKRSSIAWTVCLMISVVTFIGVCVFRGRRMLLEVKKRMNV